MKKLNYPLILGAIILFLLVVISIRPEWFTPSDPYGVERAKFVFIDGKINFFSPPVKPCPEYPWGTDQQGRDMRSLIFYGCRLTLFTALFVTLGRLLIALPLAILSGYRNKAATWLIKQFSIIFSAFPLIIVVILLVRLRLVTDFFLQPSAIISYLLIIFGWSKLASLLKEKVEEILGQDFIEGEIAIGKNRWEIALQNILPHLIPSIAVLFFLEIASVLLVLSQIGVLGVIFSGGIVNAEGDYQLPLEIDWASLLIASRWFLAVNKMWLVMYPAAAFSISIIGFNLFGEGLRIEFDKRSSKVITWIRKIPSFLSPFRLVYEIKNIEVYRKMVYRKIAFYLVVLLIIFFPHMPSLYKFNSINAFNTMTEMTKPELKGRRAGSGTNKEMADYLSGKLKEYGVQPFDKEYLHEFPMENGFNINDSSLKVISDVSGSVELRFRKDYYVTTPIPIDGTYDMIRMEFKDLKGYPFLIDDYAWCRDKILLIDVRGMNDIEFARFTGIINNVVKPKALLYISNWESEKQPTKVSPEHDIVSKIPVLNIAVSSDAGDELLRKSGSKVSIKVGCETYSNPTGYNVVGYIPGSDPKLKAETVIIGCNIDSVGNDVNMTYQAAMEAGGAAVELEAARILGHSRVKPKRTVVFAFWDAEQTRDKGTNVFLHNYFKEEGQKVFYLDLRNFGFKKSNRIMLDTTNTLPKDILAQKYIGAIKSNARRNDVKLEYGKASSPAVFDFRTADINTVIIDSNKIEDDIKTPQDSINNIDRSKLGKPGQMIVDSIYDIVCGGVK